MVASESGKTKNAANKKVNMTKGEVGKFNRRAWNYMLKQNKVTQEQLSKWKEATCPAKVNGEEATLIRYFDYAMAAAKGVVVEDYISLNEHPEMIAYEGYVSNNRVGETVIKKREAAGKSFMDEKIKAGEITEVGVIVEKTGAQKFLKGFLNFLMMGGFMVVLIVILGIVIAISVLTKSC